MPALLDGVVVVDLARGLAGPHAAMMLGDLGARVIKVETPGTEMTHGSGARRSSGPEMMAVDLLPVLQPQQGIPGRSTSRRRSCRR